MLLKLHHSPLRHPNDEVVVVDINTRCEIPHKAIDFETIEVDDAFSETASVAFIVYPLTLNEEERRRFRHSRIHGV